MDFELFYSQLATSIKENVFSFVDSSFSEFVVVACLMFGIIFIIGLLTDGKYFQQ